MSVKGWWRLVRKFRDMLNKLKIWVDLCDVFLVSELSVQAVILLGTGVTESPRY